MDAEIQNGREEFKDLFDEAMSELDIREPTDNRFENEIRISDLRRGRGRGRDDNIGMLTLVEVNGVWRWEEGGVVAARPGRRARRGQTTSGEIVKQFKLEKLPPNQVGAFIQKMDRKLTPNQGLRRWTGKSLQPLAAPTAKKRALVFIHGTFSNNDNLFSEIQKTSEGRHLLTRALKHYDEVLAFDHPTLSVSPLLNAFDLSRLFAASKAEIDIVCHSRGGLVTRWWVEGFNTRNAKKVVFVGSPLAGTSLAAPPNLRGALSLIANISRALKIVTGAVSVAAPFMTVALGLMKVVSSVTSFGANTPLVDAAVSMIPGLAGQSQVGNNDELLRLRKSNGSGLAEYYAVQSNFETTLKVWDFLTSFSAWKQAAADKGADLVFKGENDLVVDTDSMTSLFDDVVIAKERVKDFGTNNKVYHTNYFQQTETIEFIGKSLKIP